MIAVARQSSYWELLDKFSSFAKLIRITSLCRRFISRLRKRPHSSPVERTLTPMELEESRKLWIGQVQKA